jgi:hypothetical protein
VSWLVELSAIKACYKRYQLCRAWSAWEFSEPMMTFFERRKAVYQAFVEKQAGPLERLQGG